MRKRIIILTVLLMILLAGCRSDARQLNEEKYNAYLAYYQAILPCFMTAEERSAAGGDAAQAVRIWTRKESLYKCSGEGISDFLQLPPVLHDRVLFQGKPARLTSWEACGHSFSAALWGSDAPFLLNIRGEAL